MSCPNCSPHTPCTRCLGLLTSNLINKGASGDGGTVNPSRGNTNYSTILNPTIDEIRDDFLRRADELQDDCIKGTPWVFLGAAVMLEYLGNLVIDPGSGNKSDYERYTEFITNWFGIVRDQYMTFTYSCGKQDLPLQMYYVLRCAMVHSYSMIPESALPGFTRGGPAKEARRGSIVLSHRASGNVHLVSFGENSVCFVAEDFVEDIRSVTLRIFEQAKINGELSTKIIGRYTSRPPLTIV